MGSPLNIKAPPPDLLLQYQEVRDRAEARLHLGETAEALTLLRESLEVAQAIGDPVLVDRAVCNRAAVSMLLGASLEVVPELRAVLNHHLEETNSWLAAYNLSLVYERRKDFKKGAFYARVAGNVVRRIGKPEWIASSLNQLANCLVGDCHYEAAAPLYTEALEHLPPEEEHRRYHILENVGYCSIFMGKRQDGLKILYQSLRGLRHTGNFEALMLNHIDLSFALLEESRYRYSAKHAMAGLKLAEEHGYPEAKRNALYILGQASRLAGDADQAAGFFQWLQEEFFPGSPEVSSFLHAVDVRPMLNLRA